MLDCLFCKIVSGEIPSHTVYEDDKVMVFHDIDPQAPTHYLVIPKVHIKDAADISPENEAVIGHVFSVIAKTAKQLGLDGGYRIVSNCGKDAMQSVDHLHFHVLGGRKLSWPPG